MASKRETTVEERRVHDQRLRVRRIKAQLKEVRESEHAQFKVTGPESGEARMMPRAQVEAMVKANLAKARKRLHELEWAAVAATGGQDDSRADGIYLAR
ncbi:MAG: hypothetical protein M3Q49_07895 [Actinomycetota bacterium]|nr:hypothetical protein [Actinomycetota bacterium]